MESKRKASNAAAPDAAAGDQDRAAKRRKLQEEYGDLAEGETPESTTAYGLNILDSIRATKDKGGRPVSSFFERLRPRAEDPDYYERIRLPLSLEIIERKLNQHQYSTLSSLESDFKRLVSNFKETNSRQSEVYNDAERVRKAVSNLMVKINPAYKVGHYQAVATPLPPSPGPGAAERSEGGGEAEYAGENGGDGGDAVNAEEEVHGDRETTADADSDTNSQGKADDQDRGDDENAEDESAGEGDDDPMKEGASEDEANDNADGDAPAEEELSDQQDGYRARGRKHGREAQDQRSDPTAKRRPGRPPRLVANRQQMASQSSSHVAEMSTFKGLSYQQAQEKVVLDLIKRKHEDGSMYFESFHFLPPRTMKSYYEIIAEPVSLKALHKHVRGQFGRGEATGVSIFKTWAAFEDQASLIWKNAYHYNEDGSDIFVEAQELESHFRALLNEAKTHVPEPPQQKIKLRVPTPVHSANPVPGQAKKITIHVAGQGMPSAAASRAATPGPSGEGRRAGSGTPSNPTPVPASRLVTASVPQLDKVRSVSVSTTSPGTSAGQGMKSENTRTTPAPTVALTAIPLSDSLAGASANFAARPPADVLPQVPALKQIPNLATQQQFVPMPTSYAAHAGFATPATALPRQSAQDILEAQKLRPHAISPHEALLQKVSISIGGMDNWLGISASATETQQQFVLSLDVSSLRAQLRPQVAAFLHYQTREYNLFVLHDSQRLVPSGHHENQFNEPIFDLRLRYGHNRLEFCVIAALPKGQVSPLGLTMEMERIVVNVNLFGRD